MDKDLKTWKHPYYGKCKCGNPAAYKKVKHCRKCHSKYCQANYKAVKERKRLWNLMSKYF